MKFKRIAAAVIAAACALSLAACGEDSENASGKNSLTHNSDFDTVSSAPESSISDLTGDDSEVSATDEQEQLEKIPLTDDELWSMELLLMGWHSDSPLTKLKQQNQEEFDIEAKMNDINELDIVLPIMLRDCDADKETVISGEMGDISHYFYSPETVEKHIKKNYLPKFDINNVDYTKSNYWSEEDKAFIKYSGAGGGVENIFSLEYGYRQGDEYYLIGVYTDGAMVHKDTKLSYLQTDYFDFPRKELKIKNDCLMSYKSIDDRPAWVDTAANLFSVRDWRNAEYSSYLYSSIGVIDGSLGKRMFIAYEYQIGNVHLITEAACYTYGIRSKNDIISCHGSHQYITVTDHVNQTMYDVTENSITVRDDFKAEIYKYTYQRSADGETEKYSLNDSEVSKSEFNSAEVVDYFNGIVDFDSVTIRIDDGRLVYKSEHDFNDITLGDLYEIARIIT